MLYIYIYTNHVYMYVYIYIYIYIYIYTHGMDEMIIEIVNYCYSKYTRSPSQDSPSQDSRQGLGCSGTYLFIGSG